MSEEYRREQLVAMKDGRVDATFVTGSTREYEDAGFSIFRPEILPMINGPTITCSSATLRKRPGLAERLVKAQVLGIHYATAHPDETNRILAELARVEAENRGATADRISRFPHKPYPQMAAVANAYELACIQDPRTRGVSPLTLWNLHYLRELDDSGFIDNLYAA
jgi:ABC-type nitrate/sulfonate/bicarbonate transport system substrate-binding protein